MRGARRYFEVISAAIRRHDPNHLLLGARFAGLSSAHQVVWEEAGAICDILTFNNYPWADLDENVVYFSKRNGIRAADAYALRHDWAKRPMIITEWSFPALDAGVPSSCGAGQRFRTQAAAALFPETQQAYNSKIQYTGGDAGEYSLSTAAGLVLKGRVGSRNVFDSVSVDGLGCGRFTLMVFNGAYLDIDRVESAEWDSTRRRAT